MALDPTKGGGTRGGYRPGAGRPPGSANKRTRQTKKLLDAMNCNPIEAMANIAMDKSTPLDIRAAMYRDLAGYYAPKLRSVDINANVKSEIQVVRRIFSPEEAQAALETGVSAANREIIQQTLDEEDDGDGDDD